jgi:DnaJ-class molecular chaperone
MSHVHKHASPKRMYVEPRRVPYDTDLGAYTGHPMDPRYDGPSECPECMGTRYGPTGEKCEFCAGTGHYWGDGE